MEIDAQILVGAAVTVFLALLFFGVVVLWDLALALRSLGDKIDKLEDTVDDDLTDIGHTLETASGVGGGGGTQLHLSGGGTISSGPPPGQADPTVQQPSAGGTAQANAHGQHGPATQAGLGQNQPVGGPGTDGPTVSGRASESNASDVGGDTEASATEGQSGETAGDEAPAGTEATEIDDDADTDAESDDEEDDESETESDDEEDEIGGETDHPDHPRAPASRGRFITSPDRTAWYATPLDREAIANAQPVISGELEAATSIGPPKDEQANDGVDVEADAESESESESESEADEPAVIAMGPADAEPESPADPDGESGRADEDEAEAKRPTEEHATDKEGEAESDEEGDESEAEPDGEKSEDRDEDLADEESEVPSDEESEDSADDAEAESAESAEPEDVEDGSVTAEPSEAESVPETDIVTFEESTDLEADEDDVEDTDDSDDTVADSVEGQSDDSTEGQSDDSTEDQSDDDEPTDSDPSDTADDLPEDFEPFDFEEIGEAAADQDEEVTVEEAVDEVNDDVPELSFSSHRFDVTADTTGDDAVLHFEFDPETVQLDESTERLLGYQLKRYAESDETPAGDVRLDQRQIVVEIPDADGASIKRWGDAVVDVVDRTLYLSDNSE